MRYKEIKIDQLSIENEDIFFPIQILINRKGEVISSNFRIRSKTNECVRSQKFRKEHSIETKIRIARYAKEHPEKGCERSRKFRRTKKGKIIKKRSEFKRRKLGFVSLNQYFEGSHAHHIDKIHVIYIPAELHKSVWHNIWNGEGMEEINAIAFEYMSNSK